MPKNETGTNLSTTYLTGLLGTTITSVEPISGGNNSRAFKVTTQDNSTYFAKLYPGPTADGQSRMSAEFKALEFLHNGGIDCVPKPIIVDQSRQCGIYEFVSGTKLVSSDTTAADIDQATRFLHRVNQLKDDPKSLNLAIAAEACFSFQAIIDNLETRLTQLQAVHHSSPWKGELDNFLNKEFLPVFKTVLTWCHKRVADNGSSMGTETKPETRTLNPSDFGFHNCIRRSDGELIFLDFEYFGWDDPAKMICDFLLHPAMELSYNLKQRFVENLIGTSDFDRVLIERVETAYPLFGLKWCMIILNPFLPWYRLQRSLPAADEAKQTSLLEQQLKKVKLMLEIVEREYTRFPYKRALYDLDVR